MDLFQTGLMHVLMGVFGPVGVRVGMLVLDMVMLMGRMRVGVRDASVLVFVRVGRVVGVVFAHRRYLLIEIPCICW